MKNKFAQEELAQKIYPLIELHTHLYGSLAIEDLYWLANRNRESSNIFYDSYRQLYGKPPAIELLFKRGKDSRRLLEEYYYFTRPADFNSFQVCFNLIISISSTEPEELYEIVSRVFRAHPVDYGEYRMMFPSRLSGSQYKERVIALAEGMAQTEQNQPTGKPRAVISLERNNDKSIEQYDLIREAMSESKTAAKYIVAVDFCSTEDRFPPSDKEKLFAEILENNRKIPERALAILYHVGETCGEKTPESTIRWIVEAAGYGVHRLGHALVLGMNPSLFSGVVKTEKRSERLAQIDFELEHQADLSLYDYEINANELYKEKKELENISPEIIQIYYDERRIRNLYHLQEWGMEQIKKVAVIIEVCPTSNIRIAGLKSAKNHPLLRFLKKGIPTIIGTDDPGILKTTLPGEYDLIKSWEGIEDQHIDELIKTASKATAAIISGRKEKG